MKGKGRLIVILGLLSVCLPGAMPASAQVGSVTGIILDAGTDTPLEGAQVSLETAAGSGVALGGLSRPSGHFHVQDIPSGSYVLSVRLLGYRTETQSVDVPLGDLSLGPIRLWREAIPLSEIVVTGVAGATQRTKLPFDVVQVRSADLPVPSLNPAQSMQGKVAGAQVVSNSGRPGSAPSVLLRGVTSLFAAGRSQDPLYIVDGVILGAGVEDLDALDIQSIEIVKGAAAASLYGSRAGNGVVQISTKRGAEIALEKTRYSFRTEYGRSGLPEPDPLVLTEAHEYALTPDGSQFLDRNGEGCDWLRCVSPVLAGQGSEGGNANEWNTYQTQPWPGRTYDQVNRFFTHGTFLQNHFSVEGRSGRTNYRLSLGDLRQEGILRFEPGFRRTNVRLNVDQTVLEDLTIQSSIYFSRSKQGIEEGHLLDLTRMPAGVDLLSEDPFEPGEMVLFVNPTDNESPNPLYEIKTVDRTSRRNRFMGAGTARYSVNRWLQVNGNMSLDRSEMENRVFWPGGYRLISPPVHATVGRQHSFSARTSAFNASATLSGSWGITEGIRNRTALRYLYEQEDFESHRTAGYETVADDPTLRGLRIEEEWPGSYLESIRAEGLFLITNFDLSDRYVVDALVRNDGSSLFGDENKRQWYYRLGAAWRVTQEDFFKVRFFDELKLRYSIGTAGGRPRFSAQYESYGLPGGLIAPLTLGNRNIRPEFSTEHEGGLDLSLFGYRAMLSLTYASTTTREQILPVPQPAYTGYQTQWRNAGTIESKSWEATLDLRMVESAGFHWSTKFLFDATRSKITALDVPAFPYGTDGQGLGSVFYARVGEDVGSFYGIQAAESCGNLPAGIQCDGFAVNDDGFLVWIGPDGSFDRPQWGTEAPFQIGGKTPKWGTPFAGVCVDRATREETFFCKVGHAMPDYNLGFSTALSFHGLSLYALVSRSSGFDVYNRGLQWGTFKRMTGIFDQRGVAEGDRKPLGYYDAWYAMSGLGVSSAFVEDGTFTKLREVAIGYRISGDRLSGIPGLNRFQEMGLNLTGRNLVTWHDYRGYDPEIGVSGGDTGSASLARTDGYSYPAMRTFTFSFDLVF